MKLREIIDLRIRGEKGELTEGEIRQGHKGMEMFPKYFDLSLFHNACIQPFETDIEHMSFVNSAIMQFAVMERELVEEDHVLKIIIKKHSTFIEREGIPKQLSE